MLWEHQLGVHNGVASIPSHSEPYVKVSLYTARRVRHIPIIEIDWKRLPLSWNCIALVNTVRTQP
ncbi:hypothetical protein B9T07_25420 [Limnospira fusiformis CCALA 023]